MVNIASGMAGNSKPNSVTQSTGIMKNPEFGGALLALGLVFLSLCSTGQAINCYTCNTFSAAKCTTETTCAASEDTCMKVTLLDGTSRYSCRIYGQCNSDMVSQEYGISKNFEIKCCQRNLCNGGFTASPSAVLLLSLAAALLLLLSS